MKLTKQNLMEQKSFKQVNSTERVIPLEPGEIVSHETESHPFKTTFYIQDNYENRSFLGFKYKKLVGKNAIPVGLCEICKKLRVEHDS